MDELVMREAALSGNLEFVQWLRGEGCPWDLETCLDAVENGHVEVLRWARENGCPWIAGTRVQVAAELGYTDDFGNLVEVDEHLDEDPSGYESPWNEHTWGDLI